MRWPRSLRHKWRLGADSEGSTRWGHRGGPRCIPRRTRLNGSTPVARRRSAASELLVAPTSGARRRPLPREARTREGLRRRPPLGAARTEEQRSAVDRLRSHGVGAAVRVAQRGNEGWHCSAENGDESKSCTNCPNHVDHPAERGYADLRDNRSRIWASRPSSRLPSNSGQYRASMTEARAGRRSPVRLRRSPGTARARTNDAGLLPPAPPRLTVPARRSKPAGRTMTLSRPTPVSTAGAGQ